MNQRKSLEKLKAIHQKRKMDKKQIRLTEQDLHMLVEDAVKTYLVNEGIEEGVWGGLGNAMYGAFGKGNSFMNGMKNFKQNYQNGKLASDMKAYAQKIAPYLSKMSTLASSMGDEELANDLEGVQFKLKDVGDTTSDNARRVAAGKANGMMASGNFSMNPWGDERYEQNQKYDDLNNRYNSLQNDFNSLSNTAYGIQQQYDALQAEKQQLDNDMKALQNSNNSSTAEVENLKKQIEAEKQKYASDLKAYQDKYKKKSQNLKKANAKIRNYKAKQQQPQNTNNNGGYYTGTPYSPTNGYT